MANPPTGPFHHQPKQDFGRLANGWATKTAIADMIRDLDPLGSP